MSRTCRLLLACAASLLLAPGSLQAQGKDRFFGSLESFSNAVSGTRGDESATLVGATGAMQQGLGEWDALIARIELRFAAEIGGAPPQAAARMRAALGTVYVERGRLKDGLAQFEAAAGLDPHFAEIELLRGAVLDMAGRPEDVSHAYEALWRKAPDEPAHAYLFLQSNPDDDTGKDAGAARGTLEAAVRHAGQAGRRALFPTVRAVDDAAVAAPVFAPAAYADAFARLRAGEYDGAVDRLRAAAAADPLVIDEGLKAPAVRAALEGLWRGDAAALASLEAAAVAARSSEVHRLLGLAYLGRKRYDDGLRHLREAVRLNPADERARLSVADALVEAGDPVGARAALVEAAAAMPASGLARWKLGRLSQLMGDERGALEAFEAAASRVLIAGGAHVYAAIGRLYHNQLDLDAAASAYSRRARLAPNDGAAHVELGEVYRAQGRLAAALAEFLVAALLDPGDARALATIGQLYATAGRDEDAVAILTRAAVLDPAHLEAHYALSRALTRLGRSDDARRALERFRALQATALEEERRRFKDNQVKIDEALRTGEAGETTR